MILILHFVLQALSLHFSVVCMALVLVSLSSNLSTMIFSTECTIGMVEGNLR